jgi:membrane peptidoglycan carboxypeptidase
LLESNPAQADAGDRVLPASATYVLTDILKGAVHPSMGFAAAAKSGTTSDFKDAWYIGYTSDLAVASWMGRTVTQPTPHNESMSTGGSSGLWGETGPGASWHQFMKAYYQAKKPADWVRPAEVASVTLCKLTGQPAPPDVSSELAIQDLVVKADPSAPPPAACGSPAPTDGLPAATPGAGAGLPGVLPSISPPAIPTPSLPAIVP